jgi:hypothetical protein
MHNATHMHYATRWLQHVFQVVQPYKGDIVGVALDDDQGAYIDNDTWPGPNFHRYIEYLASLVHRGLGPGMPVFINTYEMKVTASSPVWAWGNWYQSDAYSIGEHDRTQLEFSTGLLQTQNRPVMISEFQAGWLQNADEPYPRAADPTNTTLALHTLLQMGAHGIVNFPVQDTLNPAGYEAPWTNAFYSWDAALSVQLTAQNRYDPTAQFGTQIALFGDALVHTHPAADAAIAYTAGAYDPAKLSNDRVYKIAQETMDAQRGCRLMHITCAIVDLRFNSLTQLLKYKTLIIPAGSEPFIGNVETKLAAFRAHGGRIVQSARFANILHPAAAGIPNAVLLVSDDERYGFLDVVNYSRAWVRTKAARVHLGRFSANVRAYNVPPRDALLIRLNVPFPHVAQSWVEARATPVPQQPQSALPLRSRSWITEPRSAFSAHRLTVYRADVYHDGFSAVVFENGAARLIVSPCAGARAFIFEDTDTGTNLFTTIGGLRDAWLHTLPASSRDYIAKYTHPIATGTFNRCYSVRTNTNGATFAYTAPDAPPHGATFVKRIHVDNTAFTIELRAAFPQSTTQRAQQLTSFAIDASTKILHVANGYGFYNQRTLHVALVAWPRSDVSAATLDRHDRDALLTLTYASGGFRSTRYGVAIANSLASAQATLRGFANAR